MVRLAGRTIVLLLGVYFYFADRSVFSVLEKGAFTARFSPLHLLWGIWMVDMICQIFPAKHDLALGSKKVFKQYFVPAELKRSAAQLKNYVLTTSRMAGKIMLIWAALIAMLSAIHLAGWLSHADLFMISVIFLCV